MTVRHRRRDDADVVRITSAPESPRTELGQRERRYLISMSIRTACFIGAVVVGDNWLRWVLVAGAFLLPYVAVVMANSASPRVQGTDLPSPGLMHPELGPGPTPQRDAGRETPPQSS